ncbi:myb-like protein X [Pecten maximus]|uniref:myb-like protein X n=1 Tax=Pecten maximus TaxID=6579 RepID=UPI001458D431|nr:myb-like protein X [Pecten maximus]
MDIERKEDEKKENDADKERKQIRLKEGKKIDTERKEIGQKEGKKIDTERKEIGQKEGKKMDTERKEIGKREGKEINSDKKEIKEVENVWYARKPTQPARPYNKKLKSITQQSVVNAKGDAEKTQPTNVDKRRNEEDIDDQQDINNNDRGQSPEDKDVDIAKDDDSRSVSVRLITDEDMEKKAKSDRQDMKKTIITITPQLLPAGTLFLEELLVEAKYYQLAGLENLCERKIQESNY